MGNNIDFVELLGLPDKIICPRCRRSVRSDFDEYDIDCGNPEASLNNGKMTLSCYCEECEYEFKAKVEVKLEVDEYNEI